MATMIGVECSSHKHLDHEILSWVFEASVYFITVCAEPRKKNHFCKPDLGAVVLESIRFRNEKGIWFCHLVLLMPDHVHLLLSFPDSPSYSRKIGEWKHYLARHHGIIWQVNFFDHRLRDQENFDQKAEYILQNPVRAGLIKEAKDWPYQWMPVRK
jgi:REP element-mobilizing transposase RayT